jgi:hypothetical protein
MRIYGGMQQGGNLGQVAGGNFMGGAGSAINPETFKKESKQQKIYNKGMGTDNPNEREIFLRRTGPQLPMAGIGNIGNVGGLMAQSYPMYGDTINMGPAEGDYSNMPVIPDAQEEIYQRDLLMDEFRNRAFPRPYQEYTNPGQYFAQNAPLIGIGGKTVS